MRSIGRRIAVGVVLLAVALMAGGDIDAGKKKKKKGKGAGAPPTREELQIVDCLLPGQVRALGTQASFVSRRVPIRTTALKCAIRGGEFTAYDRANYETALRVWLDEARAGDAQAQYYVGEIYEKGLGTAPDYEKAAEWYRKAAEKGHSSAQINLGFLHEKGLGVPADARQAMEWYRRASGVSGVIMLDSEIAAVENELAEADARLAEARGQMSGLEGELKDARRELERESAEGRAAAATTAELDQRVSELQAKLEEGERQIRQLEEDREQLEFAGPTIEIVDRTAVRSIEVTQTGADREIVGRVEAPAGLARFTVNDETVKVTEDGFFGVLPRSDELTLVAVDQQGKRAELSYTVGAGPKKASGKSGAGTTRTKAKFGSYHALIIGNSDYRVLPDVETARQDVTSLAELLRDRYGFSVTLLQDATYLDVLAAFNTLKKDLKEKDNLLVYYAGHGELDDASGLGYWLPVDAEENRKTNWISSREVSLHLDLLAPKHILVVADSCYSGVLTRSSLARVDASTAKVRDRWIKEVSARRSRTALTSGGLQPVLDTGGGGHSIFARALLDTLGETDEILEAYRLWTTVKARVMYETRALRYEQIPEYAPIQHAGHESGEFFFVPSRG